MNKKLSFLCCGILMGVLCGCGKAKLSDTEALDVIRDFQNSNYEYTKTVWCVNPEGEDQESLHYSGKVLKNPYRQYEVMEDPDDSPRPDIGGIHQYYYEENGIVYTINGIDGVNYAVGAERADRFYQSEDLDINYDREEEVGGKKCAVYKAQGTDTLFFYDNEDGDDPEKVPYGYDVEFYLGHQEKQVVQVVVDRSEAAEKNWEHYNGADSLDGADPEAVMREKDVYEIVYQGDEISIEFPEIDSLA